MTKRTLGRMLALAALGLSMRAHAREAEKLEAAASGPAAADEVFTGARPRPATTVDALDGRPLRAVSTPARPQEKIGVAARKPASEPETNPANKPGPRRLAALAWGFGGFGLLGGICGGLIGAGVVGAVFPALGLGMAAGVALGLFLALVVGVGEMLGGRTTDGLNF